MCSARGRSAIFVFRSLRRSSQFNAAKPSCVSLCFKCDLFQCFCLRSLSHFLISAMQVAFMKAQTFSEAREQDTRCCAGSASRALSRSNRVQTVQMFDSFHVAFAMYFCIFCLCALHFQTSGSIVDEAW